MVIGTVAGACLSMVNKKRQSFHDKYSKIIIQINTLHPEINAKKEKLDENRQKCCFATYDSLGRRQTFKLLYS